MRGVREGTHTTKTGLCPALHSLTHISIWTSPALPEKAQRDSCPQQHWGQGKDEGLAWSGREHRPGWLREWPEADLGLPLCRGIISTILTVLGVGGGAVKTSTLRTYTKQGMQEEGKQVNAGVEAWKDSLSGESGSPSRSALLSVGWALLLPKARAQARCKKA